MHIGTLAVMLMPDDQDSILTYAKLSFDRHKSWLSRKALAVAGRNHLGGSIAGSVFIAALQLRIYKINPADTTKAIFLASKALKGERLPSGRKAPFNEDRIQKFWDRYRSVAHLWAAYCMLKEDGRLPFQGEKTLPAKERAARCIDFLMLADCLLNTAAGFHFDFHPDPWRIPADFPRRAPPPVRLLLEDESWISRTIQEYKPRIRR
jgi:hypothetical protein